MIVMSDAIAPVSAGMELPLPFAPLGGESIESVKSFPVPSIPEDIPQWEPFKEYSRSLTLVAKELGDRMEGKNVGPHVSRDRGRVVCASLPVFEVKEPKTPVREVAVDSRVAPSEVKASLSPDAPRVDKPEISQSEAPRIGKSEHIQIKEFETPVKEVVVASHVTPFEAKETIAPEILRIDKPKISQSEAPRIEKPECTQVKEFETAVKDVAVASRVTSSETKETLSIETPRINKPEISQLETPPTNKPEISQLETPPVSKPDHSQLKEIEKPVKEVLATSLAPANEKPEVTLVDIASARVSQNTVVQTPENAVVSHLVETVVETLAVTPALSSTGEGEIHIKLKADILDGSSVRIEVKKGELKVVVEPTSRAAEEMLLKSHEAFQNHLAERVTAWRINVGVAALDLRNNLRRRLEESS